MAACEVFADDDVEAEMAYAMKADRWPVIELLVIYISD